MKRIWIGAIALTLGACVNLPDIYLIDRHSVMEAEASGDWPQLEKRFQTQGVSAGPVNYAKETSGKRRQRAFRVLNGEFPLKAETETQP